MPPLELLPEVADAHRRMLQAIARLHRVARRGGVGRRPTDLWDHETRDVGGTVRPLRDLPMRRWQEAEVHLVDLGIGVTHRQWSDAFVHARLPRMRASLADRLPAGATPPPADTLDPHDELAWLYGRLVRDDLPELAPWG